MLVDANILLYAVDAESRSHDACRSWLEDALNGPRRVGLPWASLIAFARISTHARALDQPLTSSAAWAIVDAWLAAPAAWIPQPGIGYGAILGELIRSHDLRGNLIADAALAALCVEHGLAMVSADSDFARFTDLVWFNPTAA